jgi:hypothetical protein
MDKHPLEQLMQLRLGLGQVDSAGGRHSASEADLVVVDVLAEPGLARDHDREEAERPAFHDRPRPTVADDGGSVPHSSLHLGAGQVVAALSEAGGVRGPELDQAVDPEAATALKPRVDPLHQPVEGMVIGTDGDEHQRLARLTRGHLRTPSRSQRLAGTIAAAPPTGAGRDC